MAAAIGFDVYGTLVDPLEMNRHLRRYVDDDADHFAALWREKQIEYAFRRGLMRRYESFDVCTRQALLFAVRAHKVELSNAEQDALIAEYQNLRAFPDVAPGLRALTEQGHTLVAFSNGVEATVRALLDRAGILPYLDGVVSVDDVQTFKPDPAVYTYLARRLDRPPRATWLVSANGWDVIGAKAAGLRAAWLRRQPDAAFDPWGIEPDCVAESITDLAASLPWRDEGS